MRTHAPYGIELVDDCTKCPLRQKGYFCQMADDSIAAFGKVKFTTSYPAGAVLFVEGQVPRGVYMLCQGQVKLTTASPEGKTIMRVAEAGKLLGLHSAISGDVHELTAETLQTCQVDFVRRRDFLELFANSGISWSTPCSNSAMITAALSSKFAILASPGRPQRSWPAFCSTCLRGGTRRPRAFASPWA